MQKEELKNIKRIKKAISKIFEEEKNGPARINVIVSKIKPFLDSGLVKKNEIYNLLEECSSVEEKDVFTKCVLSSIRPFFDLKEKEQEKIKREIFLKEGGFKTLNKVLSYGEHFYDKDKKVVHVHLAPAKELKKEVGETAFLELIKDGIKKLAEIVKKDKKIKKIAAISWLVAQRPKVIESLGFTIKGEINQEFRKKFFPYEPDDEEIMRAIIKREKFLKRYL